MRGSDTTTAFIDIESIKRIFYKPLDANQLENLDKMDKLL